MRITHECLAGYCQEGACNVKERKTEELRTRRFFEDLECTVERIRATSTERSADYRVSGHGERFIVEVKCRGPDLEFKRELEQTGHAGSEDVLGRTNPVSKQLKIAAAQLGETDPHDSTAVRLVSLVAAGDQPDVQVTQFESTLYGTVQLARDAQGTGRVPCFYFAFSDFYRFQDIDGALILSEGVKVLRPETGTVVIRGGGPRLCLNTFGRRVEVLTASHLYLQLASIGIVIDPVREEAAGQAFLADTTMNRRDEAAVLDYVQKKYNRPELLAFKPIQVRSAIRGWHMAPGASGESPRS